MTSGQSALGRPSLHRRSGATGALVLTLLLGVLALMALASACGSNGASPGHPVSEAGPDGGDAMTDGGAEDVSEDWLAPPPISRDAGEGTLAPLRQACTFEAGAWPAQTIGNDDPIGTRHPDQPHHRDHAGEPLLRSLPRPARRAGLLPGGRLHHAADGGDDAATDAATAADASERLQRPSRPGRRPPRLRLLQLDRSSTAHRPAGRTPTADGGIVVPHPDNEYCYGVNHSWENQHDDWDNGKNDHFVITNNPDGQRTFFYEDDTVIPFYYALASTFSVGDRYFCSVLSSTWPNRYFLMAATSFGIGDNSFCTLDTIAQPGAATSFTCSRQGGTPGRTTPTVRTWWSSSRTSASARTRSPTTARSGR